MTIGRFRAILETEWPDGTKFRLHPTLHIDTEKETRSITYPPGEEEELMRLWLLHGVGKTTVLPAEDE